MKLIIDFDDTLFSAKDFKELMFSGIERRGIDRELVSRFYYNNRGNFTNPRNFYMSLALDSLIDISSSEIDAASEALFVKMKDLVNQELVGIIKRLGPENCFIVSAGEELFQRRKISSCEIEELFGEIHIVDKDKNAAIEGLMNKYPGEDFVFVDDKVENIERAKQIVNKEQELHVIHYPNELERFKDLIK